MNSYGGFWIRVLAYLIDWIILYFMTTLLSAVVMGIGVAAIGSGGNEVAVMFAGAGVFGISFVLNWLYFAILESSSWQGTVGKQALKLVVTDEQGERISFGRATGRYFAKFLSALIFCIGFMMAGWTGRKQGLHDFVASTLVYKANAPDLPRNSARVFE